MVQGTPEWHARRCGKLTGSRMSDVVARTKTGWGASRTNYMAEKVVERLTGVVAESYENDAMRWGKETEAEARAAYQFETAALVELVDFVDHPTIAMAGASPDGYVGDDGMVEIKCPTSATHIDTLLGASVPSKYVVQIQFQLACSGRNWCDFVSFDPRLPEHMRLWVKRVHRDDKHIAELEAQAIEFLAELDAKLAKLNERFAVREAA